MENAVIELRARTFCKQANQIWWQAYANRIHLNKQRRKCGQGNVPSLIRFICEYVWEFDEDGDGCDDGNCVDG